MRASLNLRMSFILYTHAHPTPTPSPILFPPQSALGNLSVFSSSHNTISHNLDPLNWVKIAITDVAQLSGIYCITVVKKKIPRDQL